MKIIQINPQDAQAHELLGDLYAKKGMYLQAAEHHEKAAQLKSQGSQSPE